VIIQFFQPPAYVRRTDNFGNHRSTSRPAADNHVNIMALYSSDGNERYFDIADHEIQVFEPDRATEIFFRPGRVDRADTHIISARGFRGKGLIRECVDIPMIIFSPTKERTTRKGRSSCPICTPSAITAAAMSISSLTIKSTLFAFVMSRSFRHSGTFRARFFPSRGIGVFRSGVYHSF